MPIDASIPLSGKPAQIDDPLAVYGKVLAIKNAQQNQEVNAQKLQEGELDLQQKQRAVQYQKDFTGLLQKNTVRKEDGTISTDWGGVSTGLVNAGYGPEALAVDENRMKAKEAGLKLVHEQNTADFERAQAVGRTLGALPQVDEAAPPEVQTIQKSAWSAAAPVAVAGLVKGGQMSPQQGSALIAQIQQAGGWTPEIGQFIKQKQMEGLNVEQQTQHIQAGINAAREGDVAKASIAHNEAETEKLTGEALDKAKSDAAVQLSGANNAAEYDAARAKLRPGVAALLPESKSLDFSNPKTLKDTQERILTSGMNAQQLQQHLDRKDAQSTRDLAAQSLIESRRANEQFRQFMTQGQPSPAQREGAKRIDFIDKTEPKLWKESGELAAQLKDGNPLSVTTYVTKDGSTMPMDDHLKASADKPGVRQDAVTDMQKRLEANKDTLRKAINKKYDIMEQFGGEPEVSRETALKAVDNLGAPNKARPTEQSLIYKPNGATTASVRAEMDRKPMQDRPTNVDASKVVQPLSQKAAGAPQKWNDGHGGTWEENQKVWGPDDKPYIVTGYKNGKVMTRPAKPGE